MVVMGVGSCGYRCGRGYEYGAGVAVRVCGQAPSNIVQPSPPLYFLLFIFLNNKILLSNYVGKNRPDRNENGSSVHDSRGGPKGACMVMRRQG